MRLAVTLRSYLPRHIGLALTATAAIVLLWFGLAAFRVILVGLLAACLAMAGALWFLYRRSEMRQDELVREFLNRRGLKGR